MAHSPAYFLAAWCGRSRLLGARHEAKITDPVIQQLDKVRVGTPPTANVEQYKQGATVTIWTKDGRPSQTPSTRRKEPVSAASTGLTSMLNTARWYRGRS